MRLIHALSALIVSTVVLSGCGGDSAGPAGPTPTGAPPTLITVVEVKADVNVTSGMTGTSENFIGQSVTVPAGNTFSSLRFHWYTRDGSPTAFGTLYLLDREYLRTPASLGPSTPGFVARSESIADGVYVFAASVVINGGRRYWFYTDAKNHYPSPMVMTSFNVDTYPGGDMYNIGMPNLEYRKSPASWLWTPQGYVIPPPGTYIDTNFRLQAVASQGP